MTQRATLQARKFGAVISSAHGGCTIAPSKVDGLRDLELGDGRGDGALVVRSLHEALAGLSRV